MKRYFFLILLITITLQASDPSKKLLQYSKDGHFAGVVTLLARNARANPLETDENGDTALHHLARHSKKPLVRDAIVAVLEANGNPKQLNNNQKTPIDLAEFWEIKELLQHYVK